MSEATGLSIVIEPKNALAVFTQPDHIESILQQVEKEVNSFVADVSTKKRPRRYCFSRLESG